MNEIILNKKTSIERCLAQIDKYYSLADRSAFETDFLRQDAVCMNVQRACELAIDIANHLIKIKKLGLPQDSRDSFSLLERAGLIGAEQMKSLQSMVGFRNILVHDYKKVDPRILVGVIERGVRELLDFANNV
ncbi:MAG: type VII toxin-antitoxin system HepT family RNase toxin, partial [Thermoguttaceae bacterium]